MLGYILFTFTDNIQDLSIYPSISRIRSGGEFALFDCAWKLLQGSRISTNKQQQKPPQNPTSLCISGFTLNCCTLTRYCCLLSVSLLSTAPTFTSSSWPKLQVLVLYSRPAICFAWRGSPLSPGGLPKSLTTPRVAGRPRVFFDIQVGKRPEGRIVFELVSVFWSSIAATCLEVRKIGADLRKSLVY